MTTRLIHKFPTMETLYFEPCPEIPKNEPNIAMSGRTVREGHFEYGFIVEGDSTDHFHFRCPNCKDAARVIGIEITEYKNYPELYFTLYCNKCKLLGRRKVWVGWTGEQKVQHEDI